MHATLVNETCTTAPQLLLHARLDSGAEVANSLVLARKVPLLEHLLDSLLGVLASGNLLEGLGGNGSLESLKLESVTGGEEVVVVDGLSK